MASSVDSRIAFALPFFKMEILAIVMPTFSVSSVTLIFRFANITSILMMIAMWVYTVRSFSDFSSTAFCSVFSDTAAAVPTTTETKIRSSPIITPPAMSSFPR